MSMKPPWTKVSATRLWAAFHNKDRFRASRIFWLQRSGMELKVEITIDPAAANEIADKIMADFDARMAKIKAQTEQRIRESLVKATKAA